MVLKKPYAFLIKYFKVIHVLLMVLSAYLIYKTSNIVNFFRSYVANNYSAIITPNMASGFVSIVTYLIVCLLIILIITIILLLNYKKKPKNFYILFAIYYFVLLILLLLTHQTLISLQSNVMKAETARIFRDISIIAFLPQIWFVIVSAIRALGFNIKQFNFAQDLIDLEIASQDSEEVEVNFNLETFKAERNIRKYIREFGYYIKENLVICIIIAIISVGLIIYSAIGLFSSFTDNYKINESFTYKNLVFKVEDAIITNQDQGGNTINDKHYLVIKLNIQNNTKNNIDFDSNLLKLEYNEAYLTPFLSVSSFFKDIGESLTSSTIKSKTNKTYAISYQIDEGMINGSYKLKIFTGSKKKLSNYYPTSISVKLKTLYLNQITDVSTTNLNEEVSFSGSYIGDSKILVSNYQISDTYLYEYQDCSVSCTTFKDMISSSGFGSKDNMTLLIINTKLDLDQNTNYYKSVNTLKTFTSDFVKIKYSIGEDEYTPDASNVTPTKVNTLLVIKLTNKIKDAEKISVNITIRNKKYTINLK